MTSTYSNKAHRRGLSSFFFLMGFCFASWASRIPYIQQKLHLDDTHLGIVLFALPVGSFLSLPASGWLVSKFGSKKIVSVIALCYPIILLTIGLAQNVLQLVIALFCFGLAGNAGNIAVNTQAIGVEALYKRNIMGSFHGVWSLAGFTGAAVGSLMTSFSIFPAYHFSIVVFVCIIIYFIASRYLLKADVKSETATKLFALPDKSLWILGLIAFSCMICEGTMFDWSGIYFKKVVDAPPKLVGAGYTAFMCTMALSRFVSDFFTNKYGFKPVVTTSGIIIMTGLLTAVIFPTFYPSIIGFLLVGIGVSSIVPLVYSKAGKSKTLSAGVALATVSTISFFGFLVGPPLIGLLSGFSGLRLAFTVIAAMGLCVTIFGSIYKDNYQKQ